MSIACDLTTFLLKQLRYIQIFVVTAIGIYGVVCNFERCKLSVANSVIFFIMRGHPSPIQVSSRAYQDILLGFACFV